MTVTFPEKTDKNMGRNVNAWCHFHKAYGHDIEHCYALMKQIEEHVKRGLLQIVKGRVEETKEASGM